MLIANQTGTHASKIIVKNAYRIYRDECTLKDCNYHFSESCYHVKDLTFIAKTDEIHHGVNLELYYA